MNAGGAGGDIAHLPEAQQPERAGPQHTQVVRFEARKFLEISSTEVDRIVYSFYLSAHRNIFVFL